MRLPLGLTLTTLTLAGALAPSVAQAAVANCVSPLGDCEVSNVPEDSLVCNCADGSGGGAFGGNMWAGLSEMELQPICDAELASFCGGVMPPAGVPCGTANGVCEISNDPFDSITCECTSGLGFGFGGGNMWAGLSDAELVMICEGIVDTECAGPPPPPPPPTGIECMNRLGTCTIDSVPEDTVYCECANGVEVGGGGGMEWAGLSLEELEMVCVDQIMEACGEEGGTTGGGEGTSGGDTGETGDEGGSTGGGEGTTTSHGDTGMDDSGSGGESGVGEGTSGGGSTSGAGTEGGSEGSGGESGGGGGGGGGCSVAPRGAPGGLALALLGLLGLGRRRRRA